MTLADLVEGKRGVNSPYRIRDEISLREHGIEKRSERYHQLLFSYFSRQISDEDTPFSFPFRCTSRNTGSPVQLEGSTATRHQHWRRSVEAGENPRSFVRGGESEETIAGRWTAFHAPDRSNVNRHSYRTQMKGGEMDEPSSSTHFDTGDVIPTHLFTTFSNVLLVHPHVEVPEVKSSTFRVDFVRRRGKRR